MMSYGFRNDVIWSQNLHHMESEMVMVTKLNKNVLAKLAILVMIVHE
jgi:hypothetical protein